MPRTLKLFVAAAFMAVSTGIAPSGFTQPSPPDFGDDTSPSALDGECDDPRFSGAGMTDLVLLDDDAGRDATDCRTAWQAGRLQLAASAASRAATDGETPDFGDDESEWAMDGECDDKRFVGPAMTSSEMQDEDIGHDATDCRTAWQNGKVRLIGSNRAAEAPDFGDDASDWARDGECDDPRFVGPGMTATLLLPADMRHDATDCRAAWEAGQIELR